MKAPFIEPRIAPIQGWFTYPPLMLAKYFHLIGSELSPMDPSHLQPRFEDMMKFDDLGGAAWPNRNLVKGPYFEVH